MTLCCEWVPIRFWHTPVQIHFALRRKTVLDGPPARLRRPFLRRSRLLPSCTKTGWEPLSSRLILVLASIDGFHADRCMFGHVHTD